jgi:hypothetical protein
MTQYACFPHNTVIQKCFKSPNLALNTWCCNEDVATDTIAWVQLPCYWWWPEICPNLQQHYIVPHWYLPSEEHIHVSQHPLWSHHW